MAAARRICEAKQLWQQCDNLNNGEPVPQDGHKLYVVVNGQVMKRADDGHFLALSNRINLLLKSVIHTGKLGQSIVPLRKLV